MGINIYALYFTLPQVEEAIIFYVGRSHDVEARLAGHRSAAKRPSEDTNKYLWCRELEAAGIEWNITTLARDVIDDMDSEYEWVLRCARHNLELGYQFIDGYPLTNMKAGDLIGDMLHDHRVVSRQDIIDWRVERQRLEREQRRLKRLERSITYERKIEAPRDVPLSQFMNELAADVQSKLLHLMKIKRTQLMVDLADRGIEDTQRNRIEYLIELYGTWYEEQIVIMDQTIIDDIDTALAELIDYWYPQ